MDSQNRRITDKTHLVISLPNALSAGAAFATLLSLVIWGLLELQEQRLDAMDTRLE